MKILIACYPRVGNRYFLASLQKTSKKHYAFASHDRNLEHLYYSQHQMQKTDLLIHLVANPYDSVMSFINAFGPAGTEKEIMNFKIPESEVAPWPLEYIENCSNSFAISNYKLPHSVFNPSPRRGHDLPEISHFQKHNYIELMLRCDFFQYEDHFDRIANNDLPLRMISIKYEGLSNPENIQKIKEALGPKFDNLEFPTLKLRKSIWQDSVYKDHIREVYSSVYKKYLSLPDVKVSR